MTVRQLWQFGGAGWIFVAFFGGAAALKLYEGDLYWASTWLLGVGITLLALLVEHRAGQA